MSDTRSRTVVLGGKQRTLKLTAGHIRYAQLEDVDPMEGAGRTDLEWGARLVYVALLPELEDTEEKVVMKWLMDCEEGEEICGWLVSQFFEASETLEKSLAPRQKDRIQEKRQEAMQKTLEGLGLNSTLSTA